MRTCKMYKIYVRSRLSLTITCTSTDELLIQVGRNMMPLFLTAM